MLRSHHDGRNRRYGTAIGRGRYRFTFGNIFDSPFRLVLYSSLSPSARVLVRRAWHLVLDDDPIYVPPLDSLFDYQFERRLVGNT